MPDVVYHTVDGLQVTLESWNWELHIQPRHPEVTEQDIADALTAPQRISDHRAISTQRVYQGAQGPGAFFAVAFRWSL
jgi:hypothetical protein